MNSDAVNAALLAGGSALLGFLAKTLWERFKKDKEEDHEDIKELTAALNLTQIAITKLDTKMEMVLKRLDVIPELEKDVNALGQKLRDKLGN